MFRSMTLATLVLAMANGCCGPREKSPEEVAAAVRHQAEWHELTASAMNYVMERVKEEGSTAPYSLKKAENGAVYLVVKGTPSVEFMIDLEHDRLIRLPTTRPGDAVAPAAAVAGEGQ